VKVVEKTQTLKMFVGGRWIASESGETFEARSPATGEVIATLPKGTRADAVRALEAAAQARQPMAALGAFDRAALLHRVADVMEGRREELARWLTLDQGKPYKAEALGEVGEAIEYFRIAAEDIKRLETNVIPSMAKNKLVFTLRIPRGVYALITPWNWPLTMATELIAPALAGGNTIVWAPATSTSAISVKLMECLAEADLPAGAVNLVTGPGSVVGDEIAGHPLTAGVGFVGSTETGRQRTDRDLRGRGSGPRGRGNHHRLLLVRRPELHRGRAHPGAARHSGRLPRAAQERDGDRDPRGSVRRGHHHGPAEQRGRRAEDG